MATRSVATVFGGSGFLGRYVVKRLAAQGYVVRVAVRRPEGAQVLRPMGAVGQVVPLYASLGEPATIARAIDGASWVVNLVGILAEAKPGDFKRLMGEGPGHIARECASAGVSRLVQVSAIGADAKSPSGYARAKAEGEQAALAAFSSAVVLRPSLVFGPEDSFFNRFAGMARIMPFMPVISGKSRFQPVYVGDVADAAMAALRRDDAAGRTYELGGPDVFTFREILAWILKQTGRKRPLVEIPMEAARLQASILERLPGKMLTLDQLAMLSRDNVVSAGALGLAELGITPTPVDLVVPGYLARFRPGGARKAYVASLESNRT